MPEQMMKDCLLSVTTQNLNMLYLISLGKKGKIAIPVVNLAVQRD